MFFVRDANPGISVEGPSFGPTTGGTEVILDAWDALNCMGTDLNICPLPTVTFGGVPATVETDKFVHGALAVITPPNPKGMANVVVAGSRGTKSGRIFRYYEPNEAPPSTMFERLLVPVWGFGPGAFGSNWRTDVTVLNNTYFEIKPFGRSPIAMLSTESLDFGDSRAGGVLFFPPADFSSQIGFGSTIRDTSRQSEDYGTEIPVVRENEFRTTPFSLLNVPIDARFRDTVRIYNPDSVDETVIVQVYAMGAGNALATRSVVLLSGHPCALYDPCASDDPAFAMFDLQTMFPEVVGQQWVRVQVVPTLSRLWAMVTVTNNETQHVTAMTPQ